VRSINGFLLACLDLYIFSNDFENRPNGSLFLGSSFFDHLNDEGMSFDAKI